MNDIEKLLKELTEANGVPGYENEIRNVIQRYFEPFGLITHDKIGSLICRKDGEAEEPKIVLAGHMDEIGFMVKYITEEGFVRFTPLGGLVGSGVTSPTGLNQGNQGRHPGGHRS